MVSVGRPKRAREANSTERVGSSSKKRKLADVEQSPSLTAVSNGLGRRRSVSSNLNNGESPQSSPSRLKSRKSLPAASETARSLTNHSTSRSVSSSLYDFDATSGNESDDDNSLLRKPTWLRRTQKSPLQARSPSTPQKLGRKTDRPIAQGNEKSLPSGDSTPKRRGRPPLNRPKPNAAVDEGIDSPSRLHKPYGSLTKPDIPPPTASPLKGILTPSKNRVLGGDGRRKSVAFDDSVSKHREVFFEDIPGKAKKPRGEKEAATVTNDITPRKNARNTIRKEASQKVQASTAPEPTVAEEQEGSGQEEDDEVCEICLKPDSKPPNEIIFCDNCDLGYHQVCHDVPTIPEGDWLCRACCQDDLSKSPGTAKSLSAATVVTEAPDIANLETHLRSMQRILIDRCSGQRPLRLTGHEESFEKVRQVVEQTVVSGEGNSMLLIGGRGCGKTTLVNKVIADVSKQHRNNFHLVRLSGFIHTDDKLALKDIWRQLGKEMEVEDELMHRSSYADTLASLLALLSHPSEMADVEEGVTSKSVVFVIDEFDMFAYHPRQTLLYNLFDIAQSRKAPIAVLGCTTRVDVVELLEKRVKSRFSHRYVYIAPPKNLPGYWEICKQGLLVSAEDAEDEGMNTGHDGYEQFAEYWGRKIERLYKDENFQGLLQYHYYTTKSVSAFLWDCIMPLSMLSVRNMALPIGSTKGAAIMSLSAPSSKLHLLSSLAELDLGLLIAAARLDIVAHTDTVNFAMAYDEYSSLMGRQRVQTSSAGMLAVGGGARVWSRGVAGLAWERLVDLGLLVPAGLGGSRALRHGNLESKMWKVEVALEEIPSATKLSTILAKWCKEI